MMVCVLPLPECPYAKKVQLTPRNTLERVGATMAAYTLALSSSGLNIALNAGELVHVRSSTDAWRHMETDTNAGCASIADIGLRTISPNTKTNKTKKHHRANT